MLKESMIVIVLLTILGYTLFAVAILRLHMFPIYDLWEIPFCTCSQSAIIFLTFYPLTS
jgi:hypothetical protein